jgi:hypothetical protein
MTQHEMILEALRKIGATTAAPIVKAIWATPPAKKQNRRRIAALLAYPAIAPDATSVDELWRLASAGAEPTEIQTAAETAFASLAREQRHLKVLAARAKRAVHDANSANAAAEGTLKARAVAANKALDDARAGHGAAVDAVTAAPSDPVAAAKLRAVESAIEAAKDAQGDASNAYVTAARRASVLQAASRRLDAEIASVLVAIRCKADIQCFAGTLSRTPAQAFDDVRPYLADPDRWHVNELRPFRQAEVERAMLELGKRGTAASAATDTLIEALVRDDPDAKSVELAVTKIAPLPCDACVRALTGNGRAVTRLRSYFVWAGRP